MRAVVVFAAAPASACDPATPTLTIITGPLPAGCDGGVFMIDGVVSGTYPVSCAVAPAGTHTIGSRSATDCAGMGSCKVDLVAGLETVLDLRTAGCR